MPKINAVVNLEQSGSVGVLTVNNPPVNVLSELVREGIQQGIKAAVTDVQIEAIVIACAGRTFIAGADVTEFGQPRRGPDLNAVLEDIEASSKPTVAAIHGTALGGGLEVALACHYRVSSEDARVGQPEVNLGIIPGAGGTQRLPRVVGVEKAIEMITSGLMVPAQEALQYNLIDRIINGDLVKGAVDFAAEVAKHSRHIRVRDRDEKIAPFRDKPEFFESAREKVIRAARGAVAPVIGVGAIEATVNLPFEQGLKRERELLTELINGPQAKAQMYFFFAEREAGKIPGLAANCPVLNVEKAAVIGAGAMGSGITVALVDAGIPVTLIDQGQQYLDRGLANIRKVWERRASRGALTNEKMEQRMGFVRPTLDFKCISEADMVIEAVYEQMSVKKMTFAEIDKFAKPGAILGSNTSSLNIDEIAASISHPESVIGLHFFNPANIMRLLEVVRGRKTSDTVIASAMALGRRLRKVPVLVRVCHGFVGNRMFFVREKQALRMLYEGALPEQIDRVLYEFGFPMGTFALMDLTSGIELHWRMREGTGQKEFIVDRLVELGRIGQKAGKGFYRYERNSRTPIPDSEVHAIIIAGSRQGGYHRREINDEEIRERLLYPIVNEAAKILQEGVAIRPSDIDVVWVTGYGWPAYRGGPMYWADSVGLTSVRDTLKRLQKEQGDFFQPAALLNKLGDEGKKFADFKPVS
jgi:3-hydroxyacyl-CoA dehydrogenase